MVWFTHAETVGTSPARLLPFSPRRKSFSVKNNSTANIYLGPDTALTTSNGFLIAPGGSDFWSVELADEVILEVYAVGDVGSQNVRVRERIEGEPQKRTE